MPSLNTIPHSELTLSTVSVLLLGQIVLNPGPLPRAKCSSVSRLTHSGVSLNPPLQLLRLYNGLRSWRNQHLSVKLPASELVFGTNSKETIHDRLCSRRGLNGSVLADHLDSRHSRNPVTLVEFTDVRAGVQDSRTLVRVR
jgi:hypothetical protein